VNASNVRVRLAVLLLGVLPLAQCGSPTTPTPTPTQTAAIFEVRSCPSTQSPDGDLFRILLQNANLIAQTRALIGVPADRAPRIVLGRVLAGDGGFNAPWRWHLDPATISFAGAAADTWCASDIEENLGTVMGKPYLIPIGGIVAEDK
jgi:hypothetical protein